MNFEIDPAYRQLCNSLLRFLRTEIGPLEEGLDRGVDVPPPELRQRVRRRSAELGFYGADFPEDVGGSALPQSAMALLREAALGTGMRLAADVFYNAEGPSPILLAGTPAQRERYLEPLVQGRLTKCFALTESEAGSDVMAMCTTARQVGGGWVLNGSKSFISDADRADFAIVFAVTDAKREGEPGISAFIVEADTPGFKVTGSHRGMSGEEVFDLTFDDCFVGDDQVVGGSEGVDMAFYLDLQYFALPRLAIAATCNGIADCALRMGIEHAKSRQAFGGAIGRFPQVQALIVDSMIELRASRLMTQECADMYDRSELPIVEASAIKLYASEMAGRVVDRMIQVFGAAGWTRDLPLERLYRYARAFRIMDGTTELQRWSIARTIGLV
jgi:alkylation response protein AidB-like acyl-CoA dehydrogenase